MGGWCDPGQYMGWLGRLGGGGCVVQGGVRGPVGMRMWDMNVCVWGGMWEACIGWHPVGGWWGEGTGVRQGLL